MFERKRCLVTRWRRVYSWIDFSDLVWKTSIVLRVFATLVHCPIDERLIARLAQARH
jgi:hypothetical protein